MTGPWGGLGVSAALDTYPQSSAAECGRLEKEAAEKNHRLADGTRREPLLASASCSLSCHSEVVLVLVVVVGAAAAATVVSRPGTVLLPL